MKILLKHDSRDKSYSQMFGQTIILPEECNFDTPQYDDVQPIGDVKCTCYSACDIAEDQQKIEFDILDLWKRIPSNQLGADPRNVLKEVVTNGLLPKGGTERIKVWKSYWSGLDGARDKFDNARSAIYLAQSPIMLATYWHEEWLNVPALGIMPVGKTKLNGHAYCAEGWVIKGWETVNGEPMLVIEAWVGKKMYMPRETFNKAMEEWGTQCWVLSTSEIDERRKKGLNETIKDLIINALIIARQLLNNLLKKQAELPKEVSVKETYEEVKEALKPTMIEKWAKAIAKWEGDTQGTNPGNLKYSPLTQQWGGKKGRAALDGGYFCIFDSYSAGFKALCNFLELGAKDQLKAFHNARTLEKFMVIYAGRPPQNYIKGVAQELGISLDTNIKTFL